MDKFLKSHHLRKLIKIRTQKKEKGDNSTFKENFSMVISFTLLMMIYTKDVLLFIMVHGRSITIREKLL